jgi:hypothetical protein
MTIVTFFFFLKKHQKYIFEISLTLKTLDVKSASIEEDPFE